MIMTEMLVSDEEVRRLMATDYDEPGSDRVRLTERDLLIQIRERQRFFTEALGAQKKEIDEKGSKETSIDHEKRLRVLENFRWWVLGAIAAAGVLGGLVAKIPFPH